jgi:hypothetical protein
VSENIAPVIREVPETLVYYNPNTDEILIKQPRKFVAFPAIYAEKMAKEILAAAGRLDFAGGAK